MGITTIPTLNKPSVLMGMPGVGGSLIKTTGNVYYVNGFTGLDTRTGLNPNYPLLTIAHALTHCVNDHDDYIIVLDHWQEAWPVAINVTRVHIIGAGVDPNHPYVDLNAPADTAIFTVGATGNNSEIAGFAFGGGVTHAGIENTATPMGVYIHDCLFGHVFCGNTPQDGIRIGANNATNIRIEKCTFLGNEAVGGGTITRDGIRWATGGDPLGGVIKDNTFIGIPFMAIDFVSVAALTGGFIVTDNIFYADIADANPAGWAITVAAAGNLVGCLFTRNHASQCGDGTGNNPYRDLSTGVLATNLNGWAMNYSGPAVISPAIV